jgi:hypothetical protein
MHKRRTANLAERMHSFGATVGGLGVAARISAVDVEALRRRLNVGPERRPRQGLAIKTVADIDSAHLDLCFVGTKRTSTGGDPMSAFDPKRTWVHWSCSSYR